MERESDNRRRKKDTDRDRDRDRDKDRDREDTSSSTRERDRDRDRESGKPKERRHKTRTSRKSSSATKDGTPERKQRRRASLEMSADDGSAEPPSHQPPYASINLSRSSLPYPSFSKAHSREAVGSSSSAVNPRLSLYTPDPTDLGQARFSKTDRMSFPSQATMGRPPSPPSTVADPYVTKRRSTSSMRRDDSGYEGSRSRRGANEESEAPSGMKRPSKSGLRHAVHINEDREGDMRRTSSSPRNAPEGSRRSTPTAGFSPSSPSARAPGRVASVGSHHGSALASVRSATDSDATSVAPERKSAKKKSSINLTRPETSTSPLSVVDSSPRTPTQEAGPFLNPDGFKTESPMVRVMSHTPDSFPQPVGIGHIPYSTPAAAPPPPPPPPPPPLAMAAAAPKVDYLLNNGGLSRPLPRHLGGAVSCATVPSYQAYSSPRLQGLQASNMLPLHQLFNPLHKLLEDYQVVVNGNGSVAVATGYKSVARRLLDRLEAVFSRDISSEHCHCLLCLGKPQCNESQLSESGVSWGEILELVSGRQELPCWPPFSLAPDQVGPGVSNLNGAAPMQAIDVDVPAEYRDHYIRQSKKTKQAVQDWLAAQPEEPSSPPEEVDDETLIFAIMTHLEPDQRPIFSAILKGRSIVAASNAPTPVQEAQPELIKRTAMALQRLYRLPKAPRPAECTIYLIQNPHLHDVLATLAAISSGEWDILISGRFDGFLWSGAEDVNPPPSITPISRSGSRAQGPSRGAIPSRGAQAYRGANNASAASMNLPGRLNTPAAAGHCPPTPSPGGPVPLDEETEIAVLAEVEREIYTGMEALEDAFEALHVKAEAVRRALRERSTGLQMAAQVRRGSAAFNDIEVRMGTPASAMTGGALDSETDDGFDDGRSELAPDDSASNISYNRRRGPARKATRRTPAPVVEADEG